MSDSDEESDTDDFLSKFLASKKQKAPIAAPEPIVPKVNIDVGQPAMLRSVTFAPEMEVPAEAVTNTRLDETKTISRARSAFETADEQLISGT